MAQIAQQASAQTGIPGSKCWLILAILGLCLPMAYAAPDNPVAAPKSPSRGVASWYGEAHRGKLMANGKRFNPDRFTAASWFFPLGTVVKVSLHGKPEKSVTVTITDRGPAHRLVREGRIIDLGHAPFKRLAHPDLGLVQVTVTPVRKART